ncbi:hypothetical protein AB0N07_35475 [Streptomyces sp. NPDC051172]|uniref:hypothetical protein n=1 Tax=Streptomyces sp. NPDC051172 TaxID=3155796 RepID=UPI00341348C7
MIAAARKLEERDPLGVRYEVHEQCLRAAWFGEPTWVPLKVSDAGVRTFGADFWADFTANPPLEMLRCRV